MQSVRVERIGWNAGLTLAVARLGVELGQHIERVESLKERRRVSWWVDGVPRYRVRPGSALRDLGGMVPRNARACRLRE
jgi:hypothetical protein